MTASEGNVFIARRLSLISSLRRSRGARPAFSVAELVVVLGVIALLVALMLPPLQAARRQAQQTQCMAQLQMIGKALEHCRSETKFYPYWDDGGVPTRYTWIDVLIQQRYLNTAGQLAGDAGHLKRPSQDGVRVGYCPSDLLPDGLNSVRHPHLQYPLNPAISGIDYSYGISVPLAVGGWIGRSAVENGVLQTQRLHDVERFTADRVLAADAYASMVYNLSGAAQQTGVWNAPTQFDNTVAWGRHWTPASNKALANLLFHDGHSESVPLDLPSASVNTSQQFVWRPGEPQTVGPGSTHQGLSYPYLPPPSFLTTPVGSTFPDEMVPDWYTRNRGWTLITHK